MANRPTQKVMAPVEDPLETPLHDLETSTSTALVLSPEKTKEIARQNKAGVLNKSIEKSKDESDQLEAVSNDRLDAIAKKYSTSSSTFLSGVVGGAIGASAGTAIAAAHLGFIFATGPIGMALGVAVAILWFRGDKMRALERVVQKINGAIEPIKTQIDRLPKDAPQEIRDALYRQYEGLMDEYYVVSRALINERPSHFR